MIEELRVVEPIQTIVADAPELNFLSPQGAVLPTPSTVWFRALDGHWLNFKRLPRSPDATKNEGPVMLVHGTAVRASLFCPPMTVTLPAMLSAAGFDVWMLNWRASIDLRTVDWNLDDAAVLDFPAAVKVILQVTAEEAATAGRAAAPTTLKALVHCQGSSSFLVSILAGKLPEFTTVVANSSGLHPIVPWLARRKLPVAMLVLDKLAHMTSFDTQYGLYATSFGPKLLNWLVRAIHHECNFAICKTSSFIYGCGAPTMWNHDNLDDATHHWLTGEFGRAPVTLFRQIARCVKKGRVVSMGGYPESVLPKEVVATKPTAEDLRKIKATFHFVTGAENRCFLPEAMEKTHQWFVDNVPTGRHTFERFAGYGHMDVFFGKNAHVDVHPHLIDKLRG